MKTLIVLMWLLPFVVQAREENQGVQFVKGLSWSEVKEKAKKEGKYIFLDVKATWCGPCRKMEAEVFPLQEVGAVYNKQFLSVSVQVDQTDKDDEEVKKWYAAAKEISKQYAITSLPTYLYLSPNGELVYRSFGYQSKENFLAMAKTALEPTSNFLARKAAYYNNEMTAAQKRDFAQAAFQFGEKKLADSAALEYGKYLNTVPKTELMNKENLNFITRFYHFLGAGDQYFKLFYNQEGQMDSLTGKKGMARTITEYIITKEEITNRIWEESKPKVIQPDWDMMEKIIREKYPDSRAEEITTRSKYSWYRAGKDWPQAIKAGIRLMELEKVNELTMKLDAYRLNNFVYSIVFRYATDEKDLRKAEKWMKNVLAKYPDDMAYLDTYANVLYKIGDREQALAHENKALHMAMDLKNENDRKIKVEGYSKSIKKMETGDPTW